MNTRTKLLAFSIAVVIGALWAAQNVRQVRSELATMRRQLMELDSRPAGQTVVQPSQRYTDSRRAPADQSLGRRMEELEQAVEVVPVFRTTG